MRFESLYSTRARELCIVNVFCTNAIRYTMNWSNLHLSLTYVVVFTSSFLFSALAYEHNRFCRLLYASHASLSEVQSAFKLLRPAKAYPNVVDRTKRNHQDKILRFFRFTLCTINDIYHEHRHIRWRCHEKFFIEALSFFSELLRLHKMLWLSNFYVFL